MIIILLDYIVRLRKKIIWIEWHFSDELCYKSPKSAMLTLYFQHKGILINTQTFEWCLGARSANKYLKLLKRRPEVALKQVAILDDFIRGSQWG